ncbi:hypothetical protein ElyMa_004371300 [Elysia marginata]|uniref:Uncharacterized protein n=1 Tax=Elysia marginata TaxID=1093978 RepID=A0AAV4H8N1_9GAST|nr:hypothetical protein ElyMa_004371300 [Elysia marginata]
MTNTIHADARLYWSSSALSSLESIDYDQRPSNNPRYCVYFFPALSVSSLLQLPSQAVSLFSMILGLPLALWPCEFHARLNLVVPVWTSSNEKIEKFYATGEWRKEWENNIPTGGNIITNPTQPLPGFTTLKRKHWVITNKVPTRCAKTAYMIYDAQVETERLSKLPTM